MPKINQNNSTNKLNQKNLPNQNKPKKFFSNKNIKKYKNKLKNMEKTAVIDKKE